MAKKPSRGQTFNKFMRLFYPTYLEDSNEYKAIEEQWKSDLCNKEELVGMVKILTPLITEDSGLRISSTALPEAFSVLLCFDNPQNASITFAAYRNEVQRLMFGTDKITCTFMATTKGKRYSHTVKFIPNSSINSLNYIKASLMYQSDVPPATKNRLLKLVDEALSVFK